MSLRDLVRAQNCGTSNPLMTAANGAGKVSADDMNATCTGISWDETVSRHIAFLESGSRNPSISQFRNLSTHNPSSPPCSLLASVSRPIHPSISPSSMYLLFAGDMGALVQDARVGYKPMDGGMMMRMDESSSMLNDTLLGYSLQHQHQQQHEHPQGPGMPVQLPMPMPQQMIAPIKPYMQQGAGASSMIHEVQMRVMMQRPQRATSQSYRFSVCLYTEIRCI